MFSIRICNILVTVIFNSLLDIANISFISEPALMTVLSLWSTFFSSLLTCMEGLKMDLEMGRLSWVILLYPYKKEAEGYLTLRIENNVTDHGESS